MASLRAARRGGVHHEVRPRTVTPGTAVLLEHYRAHATASARLIDRHRLRIENLDAWLQQDATRPTVGDILVSGMGTLGSQFDRHPTVIAYRAAPGTSRDQASHICSALASMATARLDGPSHAGPSST